MLNFVDEKQPKTDTMNQEKLISELRDLLAKSRTETALDKLASFIQQSEMDLGDLENDWIQISGQYARLKEGKLRGTLSAENQELQNNQVNAKVLDLLKKLEDGPSKAPVPSKPVGRSNKALIYLGVIGGLVLAVVLYLVLGNRDTPPVITDVDTTDEPACPVFDQNSNFKIMVLPFYPLKGEVNNTHVGIKDRLANKSEEYQLPASVQILNISTEDANTYPFNGSEAAKFGQPCDARLIIWGTTETQDQAGDIITTRFRFLNEDDKFRLTKINLMEDNTLDTVTTLSSITTDGILTEDIEESLVFLFGLIAHENNDPELAIDLLSQVQSRDSSTAFIRDAFLADTYVQKGDMVNARQIYDSLLVIHPNYALALNNRASLSFLNGEYEMAADYYGRALEEQPENDEFRLSKAKSLIKAKRLDKARVDLLQVTDEKKMDYKAKVLEEWEAEENIQKRQIDRSNATLKKNPNSVRALENKAQAEFNLGNYEEAEALAKRVIELRPQLVRPYEIATESQLIKGDTAGAKKLDRMRMQNIKKN